MVVAPPPPCGRMLFAYCLDRKAIDMRKRIRNATKKIGSAQRVGDLYEIYPYYSGEISILYVASMDNGNVIYKHLDDPNLNGFTGPVMDGNDIVETNVGDLVPLGINGLDTGELVALKVYPAGR